MFSRVAHHSRREGSERFLSLPNGYLFLGRRSNMNDTPSTIVREELLRSIAWAAAGLIGWSVIVTESARLEASLLTGLGLPLLTWAVLTAAMIGLRLATGLDLQSRSANGLSLSFVLGFVFAGFGALYLVLVMDRSPVLVGAIFLAVAVTSIGWFRYVVLPNADTESETESTSGP